MSERAFHGREVELTTVLRRLASPSRLVTITGMPGIGKTRLLEAVAAAVSDPPVPVVRARCLPQPSGLGPAVEARAHDAPLFAIDDVDRPADGPELVRSLLAAGPRIRLVVTARAPLRLPQETVVRLAPLPRPDPYADPSELAEHPGVRIFLDTAARTGTSASLEGPALTSVARLCAALGCVPLALELVAARTATFSPATLLELVTHSSPLAMLHDDTRTDGDRNLFGALTWSQSLLPARERSLLGELSVFGSPVTVEAIRRVCRSLDLADALSHLVDVHLVEPDHSGPESRFSLPAVARHHVWQRLTGADPAVIRDLRRRHLAWATSVVREFRELESTGRPTAAKAVLEDVEADLEEALRWTLEEDEEDDTLGEAAVTLTLGLLPLWSNRGVRAEHVHLVDRVLARADRSDHHALVLRAWRAVLIAELARTADQVVAAHSALSALVMSSRALGPRTTLQVIFLALPAARWLADRSEVALWAAEGRELAARLGDEARLVRIEGWTGMLAHQEGRTQEAASWGQRALARARSLEDPALVLTPAGLLRSLPVSPWTPPLDDPDVPTAAELVRIARRCRDTQASAWLEPVAAMESLAAGNHEAAARFSTATLGRARAAGAWSRAGAPLVCLSLVAVARGEARWAARLQGMVTALLPVLRPALPPAVVMTFDESVAQLRTRHPGRMVRTAFEDGRTLSPPAVVDAALTYAASLLRDQPPVHRGTVPVQAGGPAVEALTVREREVLATLVAGCTNKEISQALGISPKTVMHHTSSIYRKLGVRGRAQAVVWELSQRHQGHTATTGSGRLQLVDSAGQQAPGGQGSRDQGPGGQGQGGLRRGGAPPHRDVR